MFSLQQWPVIAVWPFVTPWGTQLSWTPNSVFCWCYFHRLLTLWLAYSIVWCYWDYPSVRTSHFFCELAQVIKLACSDTLINNILIYSVASLFGGIPLWGIIFSYTQIVSSVLRMPSAGAKLKTFSTCGSHLSVVFLFYGTVFGVYISSVVTDSSRKTEAVGLVMYLVVPQMMNPFIDSLRNSDMNWALRKLIGGVPYFLWLCHIYFGLMFLCWSRGIEILGEKKKEILGEP